MTKRERQQRMLIINAKIDLRHQEHSRKMDLFFSKRLSENEWEKEKEDFEFQWDRLNQEYKALKRVDNIQKVKEVLIGLVIFSVLFYVWKFILTE